MHPDQCGTGSTLAQNQTCNTIVTLTVKYVWNGLGFQVKYFHDFDPVCSAPVVRILEDCAMHSCYRPGALQVASQSNTRRVFGPAHSTRGRVRETYQVGYVVYHDYYQGSSTQGFSSLYNCRDQ